MSHVRIIKGTYRNEPIENQVFELVKDMKAGAKGNFITVRNDEGNTIRVRVENDDAFAFVDNAGQETSKPTHQVAAHESDEDVMTRIEQRFDILDEMTKATIQGDIRAMIVVGPPGVGKSYGVEAQLERSGMFDKIAGRKLKYEVIKGAMTPIGLYCTLFKYSDPNNVLVFDDCDSILLDDLSLNVLKAALDSGKKRRIYWNSDSSMLRREGVPDAFDFKGSIIFITNINFDNIKSKKLQDHIGALHSRCHYLDLTLHTMRDKFLRIKQIFRKGDLFQDYDFTPEQGEEILEFMDTNKDKLREMSLRMALKLADLTKVSDNWKAMAAATCMRVN